MNDEFERRVSHAFRGSPLPAAPASLLDALERVPDAPVARRRWRARSRPRAASWGLLGVAAVLVVAGAVVLSTGGSRTAPPAPSHSTTQTRLVYQIVNEGVVHQPGMDGVAATLERRLAGLGVRGATVTPRLPDTFVVDVPNLGARTSAAVRFALGQQGVIQFIPIPAEQAPPTAGDAIDPGLNTLFGGDQLASASVGLDQIGSRTLNMTLNTEATRLFADHTAAHIGEFVAIAMDGIVLSVPVIKSSISNGQVQVEMGGSDLGTDRLREIVAIVSAGGPLPYRLHEVSPESSPRPS